MVLSTEAALDVTQAQSRALVCLLPVELLAECFLHCCEHVAYMSPFGESPRNQSTFEGVAFTLSHVCRRWLAVALSTPSLWSAIHLKGSKDYAGDHNLSSPTALLSAMLERSNQLPLSISINLNGFAAEDVGGICDALIQEAYRWKRFLVFEGDSVFERLRSPLHLPLLHTLGIHTYGGFNPPESSLQCRHAFMDVPRLQNIVINEGCDTRGLVLPWEQIINVTASSMHAPWRTISQFPDLQSYSVELHKTERLEHPWYLDAATGEGAGEGQDGAHESLKNLQVSVDRGWYSQYSEWVPPKFPRLHLPALVTLVIKGCLERNSLLRTLSMSQCPLQELVLMDSQIYDEDELSDCLRSVPTLRYLCLAHGWRLEWAGQKLFATLTRVRGNPDVAPRLRWLQLTNLECCFETVDALCEMVLSRLSITGSGYRRLHSVEVSGCYRHCNTSKLELSRKVWKEMGLRRLVLSNNCWD